MGEERGREDGGAAAGGAAAGGEEAPAVTDWSELTELRDVSQAELRRLMKICAAVAFKLLDKDEVKASEIVSLVFHKLTTTRRWNPERTTLKNHLLGAVKSEIHHLFESKEAEREARAAEGFYREERPVVVESAETAHIEREERAVKRAAAAEVLEELSARLRGNPFCQEVLRVMEDETEPRLIAERLGVEPRKVYRALENIRYHLKRVRAESGGGEKT